MQHNPSRLVRWTAVIVSGTYALALYASGTHLQQGAKQGLAYLPTALSLAVVAFDLWLWKIPGVHRFVGRPRVDGTWFTILRPHPDSHIPPGGNRGPIDAAVVIEQTYWSISITLMTAESASQSTSAAIHTNGESRKRRVLAYTYANTPKQEHRDRSHPHVGAVRLEIVGRTPITLAGTYWTDRLTVGDMQLRHLERGTDYANLGAVLQAHPKSSDGPL
ncbi:MAG: hypothetical protein ACJ74O_00145 [Frankiaceae bacterium]